MVDRTANAKNFIPNGFEMESDLALSGVDSAILSSILVRDFLSLIMRLHIRLEEQFVC